MNGSHLVLSADEADFLTRALGDADTHAQAGMMIHKTICKAVPCPLEEATEAAMAMSRSIVRKIEQGRVTAPAVLS